MQGFFVVCYLLRKCEVLKTQALGFSWPQTFEKPEMLTVSDLLLKDVECVAGGTPPVRWDKKTRSLHFTYN